MGPSQEAAAGPGQAQHSQESGLLCRADPLSAPTVCRWSRTWGPRSSPGGTARVGSGWLVRQLKLFSRCVPMPLWGSSERCWTLGRVWHPEVEDSEPGLPSWLQALAEPAGPSRSAVLGPPQHGSCCWQSCSPRGLAPASQPTSRPPELGGFAASGTLPWAGSDAMGHDPWVPSSRINYGGQNRPSPPLRTYSVPSCV